MGTLHIWFVFNHISLFVVVYCLTDYPRKGTLLNLGICIIQVLKFACNFLWWRFGPKFMNPKEYGRWNQCRCIQTSCCLKSILHWKIFSCYCPIYIYNNNNNNYYYYYYYLCLLEIFDIFFRLPLVNFYA